MRARSRVCIAAMLLMLAPMFATAAAAQLDKRHGGSGGGAPAARPAAPAPRPQAAPARQMAPQPRAVAPRMAAPQPQMRHVPSPQIRQAAPRQLQQQQRAMQQRPQINRRVGQQRLQRRDVAQPRLQRRELRAAERRNVQRRQDAAKVRAQDLKQQRELRAQQRDQNQEGSNAERRRARADRVTPDAAARGRFASRFRDNGANLQNRAQRRDDLRTARFFGRDAWRRGHRARFVAWWGPVFWPYAYFDIFYYTFWPQAYDDGYWPYAYDGLFESVYFPYGDGTIGDSYVGPYADGTTGAVTGSRGTARNRQAARALAQVCEPDKGVTAWPIDRIAQAVQPDEHQRALLDELKQAAKAAAERFKEACPQNVAMTPTGRLQAMIDRLQATLEAVRTVRPPLEAFYESLSDEQKARFNTLGPNNVGDKARPASTQAQSTQAQGDARCGGDKPALSALPNERIEAVVRPTGKQQELLDRLAAANDKAVERLQAACPDEVPQTPVGRLEAMEKRLQAMLDAAKTVQPALEEFYASLSNEQKARFNTLGRDEASHAQR